MWRSYVIGFGFLVIYLMTTFRYLAPVVHYQLDYTYISEVLCINRDKPELQCHGKCQLRKNITNLTRQEQQKDALQHLVVSFNPVEDVPHPLELNCPLFMAIPLVPTSAYTPGTSSATLPVPFHPPRKV